MLSRRDFFRSGLRHAADALARGAGAVGDAVAPGLRKTGVRTTAKRGEPKKVFLRPPGALPEAAFRAVCTRCDDCVAACPKWAIRKAGSDLGARLEGSPIIVPEDQPCWMCADMPCIAACETGALKPLERLADARMGTVRVREELCVSGRGELCDVCVDRCPLEPRPIRIERGKVPVIDAEGCTGCGVCAWLCPTHALEIVPYGR
jgi:MauM/NapG family ferredoxin protein